MVNSAMVSKDYSTSGCETQSNSQTDLIEIPVDGNLTPAAPTSILHLLDGETLLPGSGDVPDTAEIIKAIQALPPLPISPEPPPVRI